ncbi:porin family protein [Rhodobacteraceae bacterium CCMM004]|nr:porin family protein [Rhodobacteraceae bacterium CCMM004]
MRSLLPLSFAALVVGTMPALAAGPTPVPMDPPVLAPAPVALPSPYDWSGLSVGTQLGFGDVQTTGPALQGDGPAFGLRAYYDYDFGPAIAGVGLQYDRTDIDLGGVATVDSVFRLGARVGVDSGRNFFYGTAGYAYADTDNGAIGGSDGWFGGLGYEVFLNQDVTVGAEVLYHEFDDFDLGGLEAEAVTLSLSVNYRF